MPHTFSKKQKRLITMMSVLLFVFGWISVNIYLPALPSLVHDFHTSQQSLNFSLTLFLVGFAVSQLFWGPISEKYGRKLPLIYGMVITVLGITFAMLAPNVIVFNFGRFIEALGLGSAPVLGRAILMDALEPKALAPAMAYGSISANVMPAVAPVIGGYLLLWLGWRFIFAFLLMYGLWIISLLTFQLKETHPDVKKHIKILHTLFLL